MLILFIALFDDLRQLPPHGRISVLGKLTKANVQLAKAASLEWKIVLVSVPVIYISEAFAFTKSDKSF